jgi:hypothetical protein
LAYCCIHPQLFCSPFCLAFVLCLAIPIYINAERGPSLARPLE